MVESPAAELWHFSLAFYAEPGVAEAVLALQDRCGLDVNLVLLALWHGISGRGTLDAAALAGADAAVAAIRAEMILPLRALRRRLKPNPAEDVQRLRNSIKQLEIEAEKMAQDRLAMIAPLASAGLRPAERFAAARANLARYARSEPETEIILQVIKTFTGYS